MKQKVRNAQEGDLSHIVDLLKQVSKAHYEIRSDLFMLNTVKYDAEELVNLVEDVNNHIGR